MRLFPPLAGVLLALAVAGCGSKTTPTETATTPAVRRPPPRPPVLDTQPTPASTVAAASVTAPPAITVGIRDNVLDVNGQNLTWETTRPDLEKLFGKPSRVDERDFLVNHSVTWDELGICALVTTNKKQLVGLTFRLANRPRNYRDEYPNQSFAGKLMIDGVPIEKTTDIAAAAKTKKGPPLTPMADKGYYWSTKRKTRNDGECHIETDDDKGLGVRSLYFSTSD